MQFLAGLLSVLIAIVAPAGLVLEQVAQRAVRSQFKQVEHLRVRVDSAPSYQLVNGRADRVRLAARGLYPLDGVRLEALEIETDLIAVELQKSPQLKQPLRAGVRLVVTAEDINRALRSPTVVNQLRQLGIGALSPNDAQQAERFLVLNPRVEFLRDRRIRLQATLQETGDPEQVEVVVEFGLAFPAGRQVQLLQPKASLDGQQVPPEIMTTIAEGIPDRLDLRQLERSGIILRILNYQLDPKQLEMAAFVQYPKGQKF